MSALRGGWALLATACAALALVHGVGCSSSGGDGGSSSSSGGAEGGAPAATGDTLTINEIVATGTEEWLELANKGATEIDLSDFGVADTDKATKLPKISGAMRFPAGTRLAAGAYLLVVTNKKKTDPVGPHPKESCVPGAQSICFYATFGISAADGESLYVLTKDNAVVANAQYPASPADAGADAGASGKSVCRKPDKTGELASCDPTPGAANK